MADPKATPRVELRDWPVYRNNVVDFLNYSRKRHHISGMWEVDITHTQQRIQEVQRQARVAISFNAYLIYLLSRAVMEHPEIQAVRVPFRRSIAVFDGVDVGTAVEFRVPGRNSIALPYTVREADRKSLAEICVEMRDASKRNLMETDPGIRWRAKLAHLPAPVRRMIWRWVDLDPARRRRVRGTFGLTNLNFLSDGMGPGFGIPMPLLTSGLCVGSTYERLEPCNDDPRGFRVARKLCLTFQVDHDVVDGAPGLRFARTFTRALESAEGLDDAFASELAALSRAPRPVPA